MSQQAAGDPIAAKFGERIDLTLDFRSSVANAACRFESGAVAWSAAFGAFDFISAGH